MKSPKPIEFLSRRSRAHDGSVNDGKADRIESVSSQRRQRTNLLVEGGGRSEGLAQVDVLQRHLLDVAVQLRHLNGQPIDARLQLLRSSSFRKKNTTRSSFKLGIYSQNDHHRHQILTNVLT